MVRPGSLSREGLNYLLIKAHGLGIKGMVFSDNWRNGCCPGKNPMSTLEHLWNRYITNNWTSIIKVWKLRISSLRPDFIVFVHDKCKDLGNPKRFGKISMFFGSLILKDYAIKPNEIVIKTCIFF